MNMKVTINDTPSNTPPKPAALADRTVVIDAKGRRLTIREPDLLQESRLVRALGEAAGNTNYVMLYCLPAAMVVKIDDDDMVFPTNQMQVEAAIQAVGREGMTAVMEHLTSAAKQKQEVDEDATKKSAGTRASAKPAG
jgi:hypothetical protein